MTDKKIILASASPRRREIFTALGLDFEIKISNAEPDSDENDDPVFAARLSALAKAEDISKKNPGRTVVAADTVVCIGERLLGKPKNADDARRMLRLLSGKTHRVVTAVYVISDGVSSGFEETTSVKFSPLDDRETDEYVLSGEPMDKAGAYAVQGKGMRFIEKIDGDFYNVMGFPASRFYREYRQLF